MHGLKVVTGREMKKGQGNLTAVFSRLDELRRQGELVRKLKMNRQAGTMQVWLRPPSQCKVLTLLMLPCAHQTSCA